MVSCDKRATARLDNPNLAQWLCQLNKEPLCPSGLVSEFHYKLKCVMLTCAVNEIDKIDSWRDAVPIHATKLSYIYLKIEKLYGKYLGNLLQMGFALNLLGNRKTTVVTVLLVVVISPTMCTPNKRLTL